jgi:hypothetical protein
MIFVCCAGLDAIFPSSKFRAETAAEERNAKADQNKNKIFRGQKRCLRINKSSLFLHEPGPPCRNRRLPDRCSDQRARAAENCFLGNPSLLNRHMRRTGGKGRNGFHEITAGPATGERAWAAAATPHLGWDGRGLARALPLYHDCRARGETLARRHAAALPLREQNMNKSLCSSRDRLTRSCRRARSRDSRRHAIHWKEKLLLHLSGGI